MKTILHSGLLLTILVAGLTMQSCDKLKDKFFPGFEIQPSDLQITIPVIANTTSSSAIASVTTYFNMDSIIKAETLNAFTINNVKSITVQELDLSFTNSDNANNFGNLEEISVSFHSNANTNATIIANAPLIQDVAANELALSPLATNNIRGYMNGSQLTYTIAAKARRATTKPLTCMMHLRLKMN